MSGLNQQDDSFEAVQARKDKLLKRCKECGFRRRGRDHDEGAHHKRSKIGETGNTMHMSQGRPKR